MRYESRRLASALQTRRQPAGELKRRRCKHAHKDQCRSSENLRGEHGDLTVTKGSNGREQTCVQSVAVVVDADQVDVEDPSSLAMFDRQALEREYARAAREGQNCVQSHASGSSIRASSEEVRMTHSDSTLCN